MLEVILMKIAQKGTINMYILIYTGYDDEEYELFSRYFFFKG